MIKVRPLIIFVVVVLFLIIVSFFVEVDYKISGYGKIYPYRELLIISQGGFFSSKLVNYLTGFVTNELVYRPERGDIVQFSMKDFNNGKCRICKGDTIGILVSSYINQRIKEIKGEIRCLEAEIDYLKSPQKRALVELAKEKLNYAKKDAEHKKKVFERMIELYKKDLIAQEEFDVIRNDKDLAEINVRIAEKELENVSTGEKPEHIKMITEQINKNKMMLNELIKQRELLFIKSPFSGIVLPSYSIDTLCTVRDVQKFIIVAPIDMKESFDIVEGVKVEAKVVGERMRKIYGKVSRLSEDITVLNGKQKRLVFIEVNAGDVGLRKGMIAKCHIHLGRRKLIERLIGIF